MNLLFRTLRLILMVVVFHVPLNVVNGEIVILDPGAEIDGVSQLEHSGLWWQTFINIGASQNPLLNSDSSLMAQGQVGSVYYVPGFFGPDPGRSATVQAGSTVYLNLINFIGEGVSDSTDLGVNGFEPGWMDNLFLEIDGVAAAGFNELLAHRQTAGLDDPFQLQVFTPDNLYLAFGLDPTGTGDPENPANYPLTLPSVLDGYWVALEGFEAGNTHTLHWGAAVNDQRPIGARAEDTFLTITIVPEPTALTLMLSLCACGVLRRRQRQPNAG